MNDLSLALRNVIGVFDRLALPYAVMGGIAVRSYAIPRPTYDVDFTLAISRDRLSELYATVEALGYTVPPTYLKGWVDQVAEMPLVKFRMYLEQKGVDIDVFLAETPFQQKLMERRKLRETEEGSVWFVSPEDLVLLKLVANRIRDTADVLDVLFTQGQLDEDYLRHWAGVLKVSHRLEDVLAQHRDMI